GVGPAPLVELSSIAATAAEPPLLPPPITDDTGTTCFIAFDSQTGALTEDWAERVEAWVEQRAKAGDDLTMVQLVTIEYQPPHRQLLALGEDPKQQMSPARAQQDAVAHKLGALLGADAAYRRAKLFDDALRTRLLKDGADWAKRLDGAKKLVARKIRRRVDMDASPETFTGAFLVSYADDRLIPGEHGYRFFAGFYRHLRDTMKRTPIYDELLNRFTDRTAHDALKSVKWQTMGDPERPYPTAVRREPLHSLTAIHQQYRRLRKELGYRPSDIMRFMLRLLRYMTSSTDRRAACYEQLTWWDFLSRTDLRTRPTTPIPPPEPDTVPRLPYARRFACALRHSPLALVAMHADAADARTQGNISVQLLLDNLGVHEQGDATLPGPTSDSWFRHWRSYLEHQGVAFYAGTAQALQLTTITVNGQPTKRVVVDVAWPNGTPAGYREPEASLNDGETHYVICATDLVAAQAISQSLPMAGALGALMPLVFEPMPGAPFRDPELLATMGVDPWDRMQTLTGIQLYYPMRVAFADAHMYFAQSPWGLSAVSQFQYWHPYLPDNEPLRFLGNLSIDIGAWRGRVPGDPVVVDASGAVTQNGTTLDVSTDCWMPCEREPGGKPFGSPNDMTSLEIAEHVEIQIHRGLGTIGGYRQPRARFFHLDDAIVFDGPNPKKNLYPYPINVVSDWQNRPLGAPWSPQAPEMRYRATTGSHTSFMTAAGPIDNATWTHDGYVVHFDNLLLAGTHMRTFTRMATMEAANESARHAVNAVLDHLVFTNPDALESSWTTVSSPCTTSTPPAPQVAKAVADAADWSSEPHYVATPFGDYCNIWDPEDHELDDLKFLKLVDKHLLAAGTPTPPPFPDDSPPGTTAAAAPVDLPHLFDLLDIDRLPDLVDDDLAALRLFDLLSAGLRALQDVDALDSADLMRAVERFRSSLATFQP
ncbi:MAG: hypothetical protein KC731_11860, partial [Myxococcales bacterium]|nr:hypothetical protein [Myxococcales bacterium]